jgi:LCP family protein required for cell wall assembly
MSHTPRHRDVVPKKKHRVIRAVVISMTVVLVAVLTGGYFVYQHLSGNITGLDIEDQLGTDRPSEKVVPDAPHKPMNVLLLGSDTREGQAAKIGGETPGLSDTTILMHLSADRKHAYGVSIPRDLMVQRPECQGKDGATIPAEFAQFNAAYALGGPACTIKTVEKLTNVRINHFVVIKFDGFKNMVDALDGVEVCVPFPVHDTVGHIDLPAGTYDVSGERALDYVRVRYVISANGDVGRMKRQQAFLASMANKAISAGTLINPVRLYNFLDAATKSLITDPELANLKDLAGLAQQFKNIGLSNIQFLTMPITTYEPDPNRLAVGEGADELWTRIREDRPLSKEQEKGVTSAAETPSSQPSGSPSSSPSGSPSPGGGPSDEESARAAEEAHANGLCA